MISVIICSNNPVLLKNVRENIHETIGESFEILYFDNRVAKKGICKVYNELALKAQFPYLCFVHEDVIFATQEWGKNVIEIFSKDEETGLIGIAGCKYKSAYFSGWFSNVKELDCANYIHRYPTKDESVNLSPKKDAKLEEVVCIDGVFMCCKKKTWSDFPFNENLLKGFHFYDIDFSLRIAHYQKVVVTYDISLIHITKGGDYGNNWVRIAMDYHEQMKDQLPYTKTLTNHNLADKSVIKATLDFLKNYNITFSNKKEWIIRQKLYLYPEFYYGILKFLLYKPLRLKSFHNLLKNK